MKRKEQVYLPSEGKGVPKKNQTFSEVHYQFIFCARYRRKIFTEFKDDQIEARFKQELQRIATELGLEIQACDCREDQVQLSLKAPPVLSPADIMAKIKMKTSRVLREEIKGLSHLQGLWTRAYFVTTAPTLDLLQVDVFLTQQKTRS